MTEKLYTNQEHVAENFKKDIHTHQDTSVSYTIKTIESKINNNNIYLNNFQKH